MNSDARGRGRGRGGRGGAGRGGSTGRGGGEDRPRREAILDLAKYVDERIRVKFTGGREVTGTLKGFDQLLNLVMDDLEEVLNGKAAWPGSSCSSVHEEPTLPPADPSTGLPLVPQQTRALGLAVLRGTSLVVISPLDGSEEIANPFQSA